MIRIEKVSKLILVGHKKYYKILNFEENAFFKHKFCLICLEQNL